MKGKFRLSEQAQFARIAGSADEVGANWPLVNWIDLSPQQ